MDNARCAMSTCDHEPEYRIRLSARAKAPNRPTKWRAFCVCCASAWVALAQLSGVHSEVMEITDAEPDADSITVDEVLAVHQALRNYDGPVAGLFA